MTIKKLLILGLLGLLVLTAGCSQAPSTPVEPASEAPMENSESSKEEARPDTVITFEGKITSIDEENKTLTVDVATPHQDIIILSYSNDTEFSKDQDEMLRVGVSIRFETDGTVSTSNPTQMSAHKITDAWVEYDEYEKIQNMIHGREDRIMDSNHVEIEIRKGSEFLVQLYRDDALDSNWYWEVSDESALEYQAQAQFKENNAVSSLYQMKALKKGEHFLYFHEYSPITGETLREITFQLLVFDSTNTEGNIVELVGEAVSIETNAIVLKSGDTEHRIYAPDMPEAYSFIQPGDELIIGAEIGEATYQLVYAEKKVKKETETNLPIIQHIVQIDRITEDQIYVLWNEALLIIYHNDLVTSEDLVGAYCYVEYAVDKISEANELLKIELLK